MLGIAPQAICCELSQLDSSTFAMNTSQTNATLLSESRIEPEDGQAVEAFRKLVQPRKQLLATLYTRYAASHKIDNKVPLQMDNTTACHKVVLHLCPTVAHEKPKFDQ